jgi:hypothetical protein
MEVLVASSLLGVGYLLNNNTNDKYFRQFDTKLSNAPKKFQQYQYQSDALNTNYYNTVHSIEAKKVEQNYKKAKEAINTNIVPPYFNNAIINNQTTPIQYLQRPAAERTTKINNVKNDNINNNSLENFYQPLIAQPGYTDGPEFFSGMAGQKIDSFTHNNQVPFFRGSTKQNVDPFANQTLLESFGGMNTFQIEKKAAEPMFKPTKNLTYINGTPDQTDQVLDRYVPSLYRTMETPTNAINVGPGLNKGYTAAPTGGFQQFDAQEFALPKTTDELRTLDNPKLSYEGRATGAPIAMVTNRGLQGTVKHRHPDKFYIQTPERYLKTTGAYLKPEMPGKFDAKATARQDSTSYEGVAGPAATHVESLRPSIRDSTNINYTTSGMRNVNLQNYGEGDKYDYSKAGYFAKPNERETTQDKNVVTNLTSIVKAIIAPFLDVFRTTRKEDVLGNPNKVGYMAIQAPSKPVVWNPNDVARTTVKETNINNNHTGNMGNNRKKVPVFDPNDVARTTVKETNINNNHTGNLGSVARKPTINDPNDIARTTIKETNINNNYNGNLGTLARKPTIYNPNDIARTTIKETNIHNNHKGNMGNNNKKVPVFDPNDIARTTIKETNVHNNYKGNMGNNNKKVPVFDPNDIARTTIKETNINNNHAGNMGNNNKKVPVFDPNDIARTTIKETNINNNHTGNMGNNNKKVPVFDPNDIARTTIKETNINNNHTGNMGNNNKKVPVFDPNDIARTTIKETNINNNKTGNLGTVSRKTVVYDPNDIARTTIKETNIHNNHTGNLKTPLQKGKTYDPNDILKTTIKETNIHNNHTGNMGTNTKKVTVYDPNDIARTTIKETNIHNSHKGNFGSSTLQNGTGYETSNFDAPNTNRQFTSDYEYSGIADGQTTKGPGDGYLTASFDAPNTNRQFTSDYEYEGPAKDYLDKPMDETMWDNAHLNETKTGVSEGRYPTLSNTKLSIGGKNINMEAKKLEDDRLNQYSPAATKLYVQTPSLGRCTVTTDKDQLPNESLEARFDPNILTAFNDNPYTQPLNSF